MKTHFSLQLVSSLKNLISLQSKQFKKKITQFKKWPKSKEIKEFFLSQRIFLCAKKNEFKCSTTLTGWLRIILILSLTQSFKILNKKLLRKNATRRRRSKPVLTINRRMEIWRVLFGEGVRWKRVGQFLKSSSGSLERFRLKFHLYF